MAKTTLETGENGQDIHGRTTGDTEVSQVVVLGEDGTDNVASGPDMLTALQNIETAVETIDNAISGSEMQVDLVGSIPAGTNNIGDVDIASIAAGDNNIGNVDVASIAAGDNNIGNVDIASAIPAGTNNIGDVDIASIAAGDNNIGNVDVATVPADPFGANADAAATAGSTGSIQAKLRLVTSQLDSIKTAVEALDDIVSGSEAQVDIVSMPGAARTTDAVATALQTDAIMNGFTALTPKFFSETVAASDTDEELVALVSAKKIRVLALVAQCAATATDITFESSTTTRKHKIPAGANGGQVLPFNPAGWFETAAGESLTVTTGAGSSVEISGMYVEV